jgi:hypothetical protein
MTRSISNLRIEKESPLRWRTRHLWALSRRCWRLASERLYIHSGVMLAFLCISGSLGVCWRVPICIWDIGARRIKSEYYIYIYVKALITTNHVSELGLGHRVCPKATFMYNQPKKKSCVYNIDYRYMDIRYLSNSFFALGLFPDLSSYATVQLCYSPTPLQRRLNVKPNSFQTKSNRLKAHSP